MQSLMNNTLYILTFTLLAACTTTEEAQPLTLEVPENGFQLRHAVTAPAGQEVYKCLVSDLDTKDFTYVNRIESLQTEGMHHMGVFTLALSDIDIAKGTYDCDDIWNSNPRLMEEVMSIYASQESAQEVLLPEGIVATLPKKLRVIHEIHYINVTEKDQEVVSIINGYGIPAEDVVDGIWGEAIRDQKLEIPPQQEHIEWTRCVMNKDVDVIFLASHTHEHGREVIVRTFDGENVGESIYSNTDWETPYLKHFDAGEMSLKQGEGLEFACRFFNSTDETINYGLSGFDEMCQIAIVFTPGDMATSCEIVDSSNGHLYEPPAQ